MTDTPVSPSRPRGPGPGEERLVSNRRRNVRRGIVATVLCVALAACGDVAPRPNGLSIDVTGLPVGADADVTVHDESGEQIEVAASGPVGGMGAGPHVVRAAPVVVDDVRFHAVPSEQRVEVRDDGPTTARVAYAPAAREAARSARPTGTVSLHGVAWIDRDGDGRFGGSDTVLPYATVYLDVDRNGRRDDGEPTTRTDAAGQYRFDALMPGTPLVLRHETPAGGASVRSAAEGAATPAIRHHVWQASADVGGRERSAR